MQPFSKRLLLTGLNQTILDNLFNGINVVAAEEYLLSGDIPVENLTRLNWTNNHGSGLKNLDESCEISNLCIQLNPGDLKTYVLIIERP